MNNKNKFVKKVVSGVLTLAIMLNIGLSVNFDNETYAPQVSLTSIGVQAQDEGGGFWSDLAGELGDAWDSLGQRWDSAVEAIKDFGIDVDHQNTEIVVPPGSGSVTVHTHNGDSISIQQNANSTGNITVTINGTTVHVGGGGNDGGNDGGN